MTLRQTLADMTTDTARLRELAESAQADRDTGRRLHQNVVMAPATVLALLDRLEQAEQMVGRLGGVTPPGKPV